MGFDLGSPAMQQNPYPAYAEMRRQPSLTMVSSSLSKHDHYLATRYEDVVAILKDPRFVNDARKLPNWDDWTKKWYIPSTLKVFVDTMALVDEPDHTRLRQLVHKAFTPSMIQHMTHNMERIVKDLLDHMTGREVVDLRAVFALPFPLTVIGNLVGISPDDRAQFARWMANPITDFSTKDPVGMVTKLMSAMGLDRMIKRLIADRRRSPQDDLITALVHAENEGDQLSENELIAMIFLILFAGHETTVNLIGSGTLALLQHPDQWARLKANPDLLDTAVEELLRYTNPVQHIAQRFAMETVTLGTATIPQYSTVLLGIGAANRDEAVFPDAETLDIGRTPNKHIAFGFGVHYCLGAPLARMEAKIGFKALIERFPNMQLAIQPEAIQWRGAPSLRGVKALPIRLNG
jgi:cytochrome P450 PksS